MKTVIAMIAAASFAATTVQAEESKPVGQTVAIAQQNDLPAGGLNPGIPFAVVGLGSLIAIGVAIAVSDDDDDDNNATVSTTPR